MLNIAVAKIRFFSYSAYVFAKKYYFCTHNLKLLKTRRRKEDIYTMCYTLCHVSI